MADLTDMSAEELQQAFNELKFQRDDARQRAQAYKSEMFLLIRSVATAVNELNDDNLTPEKVADKIEALLLRNHPPAWSDKFKSECHLPKKVESNAT